MLSPRRFPSSSICRRHSYAAIVSSSWTASKKCPKMIFSQQRRQQSQLIQQTSHQTKQRGLGRGRRHHPQQQRCNKSVTVGASSPPPPSSSSATAHSSSFAATQQQPSSIIDSINYVLNQPRVVPVPRWISPQRHTFTWSECFGHASFFLVAVSYAVDDFLQLRLIAIAGSAAMLIFTYFHPHGRVLWLPFKVTY
jgi:hypothetical protein